MGRDRSQAPETPIPSLSVRGIDGAGPGPRPWRSGGSVAQRAEIQRRGRRGDPSGSGGHVGYDFQGDAPHRRNPDPKGQALGPRGGWWIDSESTTSATVVRRRCWASEATDAEMESRRPADGGSRGFNATGGWPAMTDAGLPRTSRGLTRSGVDRPARAGTRLRGRAWRTCPA